MARALYSLTLLLLLPWTLLHLVLRGRRQPEYLRHWGERFGHYAPGSVDTRPLIWIHAVSVGETRAAQPLIKALRQRYPNHRILLSHMTPTGRATGEELYGDTVERVYLAYDYPWAVRRFLSHWQPCFGLIMETELWPNLLHACGKRGIPVVLVNARLSARSAGRYERLSALVTITLKQLAGVAAQSADDARRLKALGANEVAVVGNVKFDITPPAEMAALGATFRERIGQRPVFLCASTRDGEEDLLLAAWKPVFTGADAPLLVLVPRHPQRFEDVAQKVAVAGLRLQRRSDGLPVDTGTEVWLGDSLGEMFAYYAACDVAFVGGSLLDFGSQNLIEPCAVGRPVIIGPSTFNFAQAAASALAAGAALQGNNAGEILAAAKALLNDGPRRARMGEAGLAFTAAHRGATTRTLDWVGDLLSRTGR